MRARLPARYSYISVSVNYIKREGSVHSIYILIHFSVFFMSSQTAARHRKHGLSLLMFVLQDLLCFTCVSPETGTLLHAPQTQKVPLKSNLNDLPGSYSIFCMKNDSG